MANYYDGVPGMEAVDQTDPLAVLKAITAPPPPQAMPVAPAAPPPPPPPTSAPPTSDRWQALLSLVGPLSGMIAGGNPAGRAAFMQGWQDLEQQHKKDTEQKQQASMRFAMEAGQHLLSVTDPAQFEQTKKLFTEAGQKGGLDTSSIQAIQFPTDQYAAATGSKKVAEVSAELDTLDKQGYNLDDLASAGSQIQLKDGTKIPVSTALDMTRKRPMDATGKPVAKPNKLDTTPPTDFGRYLAKFAKQQGKTVDQLTTADEDAARKQFNNDKPVGTETDRMAALLGQIRDAKANGDTASAAKLQAQYDDFSQAKTAGQDPQMKDINLQLKQLQLENERNKAKGGTAFVVQPGSRDERIAKQLSTGGLTFSEFSRLLGARSAQTIDRKLAIYDKAMELNPDFTPASFELGFKFASNPNTQKQIASINNVVSGVPDLLKASDAAKRAGATALNQFVIPGGIAIGSQKYSDFKTAQIAFADELSGALGYGSATDMSREMGFNMTNLNLSPDNFRSAVENVIMPFVARKKASLVGQMGPYGNADLNPGAGGPPTAPAAPKEGDTQPITDPGYPAGAMKTYTKGRWVRTK